MQSIIKLLLLCLFLPSGLFAKNYYISAEGNDNNNGSIETPWLSLAKVTAALATDNNGGFIQARLKLSERLPKTANGLELKVRGNGKTYYIHARTGGTILPWNFYQAAFEATSDWMVVRIPFDEFTAQGRMLRKTLLADAVKSIAVVAYGRDHMADVLVASIGYY